MIPRANRLRDSKEFRQISRFGKKYKTSNLAMSAVVSSEQLGRYGFVVPKRVGNAVHRNLIKRRMRSACLELMNSNPGLDLVLRAERPALDISYQELLDEISDGVSTLKGKLK